MGGAVGTLTIREFRLLAATVPVLVASGSDPSVHSGATLPLIYSRGRRILSVYRLILLGLVNT